MEANFLKLKAIGSVSEPIKEIKAGELETHLKEFLPEPSFVVVFMDYIVLAGRWTGSVFQFHDGQAIEEKYIQRIRVFNEKKEFHAWRASNGMKARMRIDDFEGAGTDVVIAKQVLFGTTAENKANGFSELSEKRGTRLFIPFENIVIDENKNRIFIKTHNYIGYNPAGQATYTDCRFVSFADSKNDLA